MRNATLGQGSTLLFASFHTFRPSGGVNFAVSTRPDPLAKVPGFFGQLLLVVCVLVCHFSRRYVAAAIFNLLQLAGGLRGVFSFLKEWLVGPTSALQ